MTVSRWIDGVLEKNDLIDQGPNLRALVYWGMRRTARRAARNGRGDEEARSPVVIDPYPSAAPRWRRWCARTGFYLLPACTQFETSGSVTASNRSLQWRERVITPMFESQTDHAIMYAFAKKFGFDKELVKNFEMWKPDGATKFEEPTPESILKEINRSNWTIGYTGQSPERLKLHMKNMQTFDVKTLRAQGGPCDGDYFGLPWPCYGTPELKHPGSPNLYQTSRNVMDGGGNFRANFGVERDGVNLLAEDGSYSKGATSRPATPSSTTC
jgi:formate dehydrogenase major subunit